MCRDLTKVVKLLFDIPYLMGRDRPFPPLNILNKILEKGKRDAGMSGYCEWSPFQLTHEEYVNLFGLIKQRHKKLIYIEPPEQVTTYNDWVNWHISISAGNDAEYLYDLLSEQSLLDKRINYLKEAGNEDKAMELTLQLIELTGESSEIMCRIHEGKYSTKKIQFYASRGAYGYLSNFYKSPITLADKIWPTTEHYFQAQKFAGTDYEETIRRAQTPMIAAKLGRSCSQSIRKDWEENKECIMAEALKAKFTQHPDLKTKLLATGDAELIEHTENDAYWGDGGDGLGKNRLGILLMRLRHEFNIMEYNEVVMSS